MLDQEILNDFRTESNQLVAELEEIIEALESSTPGQFPTESLKEFSQKIDRIMGAAKTLLMMAPEHPGLIFLANISEMCKTMGYQAAALQKAPLLPIFAGFWADTVEVINELLACLGSEQECRVLVADKSASLKKRLSWLADKVAPGSEEEMNQVLSLLKKL